MNGHDQCVILSAVRPVTLAAAMIVAAISCSGMTHGATPAIADSKADDHGAATGPTSGTPDDREETYPLKLADIRVRDPFIVADRISGFYYLYAQCGNRLLDDEIGIGIEAYRSRDLSNWTEPERVFTRPESNFWGGKQIWAPEVHRFDNHWFLFVTFNGREGGRGTQILRAEKREGPFLMVADTANTPPEQCCLDGTPWIDRDGSYWLVYCHEWVQIGDGAVRAVRMKSDWSERIGEPIVLFKASDAPWTRPIAEGKFVTDGPFLHRSSNGRLLMIWSSFRKNGGYAIGMAESADGTIAGAWRHHDQLLFGDNGGHGSIFRDFLDNLHLVFHQPNGGQRERARLLRIREQADGSLGIEK